MSESKRIQRQNGVQGVEKALALEAVRGYCKKHGYSMDKLKRNRLYMFDKTAVFAVPSPVKPDGLCNDLLTQPYPTLIIKFDGDHLQIETTAYTDHYLKEGIPKDASTCGGTSTKTLEP